MYHPSYLTPKTILQIQNAQRSVVTLPLIDHLRVSLSCAQSKIKNGALFSDETMMQRGYELAAEYREQIRLLEAITDEGREAYEENIAPSCWRS